MYQNLRRITSAIILLTILAITAIPTSAVTVEEIRPIVEEAYFEEVDPSIFNGTVEEVFNQLDQYSTYYTQEEYDQFMNSIEQSFVGIGISFEVVEKGALIQYVFPNSPAHDAGLKPGDIITHVDQTSLNGKSSEEIITNIGGPKGSSVQLTIDRDGTSITTNVSREQIQVPIVNSTKLAGNIGYIHFSSFSQDLLTHIQEHKQSLNSVDRWIIDIRNNGGGLLSSAQKLLGMFPGVDTTMIANFKDEQNIIKTLKQDEKFTKPMKLLINQYSASASEIFAAALKDYKKATLYGETTYGKGRMQQLFQLPEDGGVIKLTVATFLSPLKNMIDEVGVQPHINSNTPLVDAHWDQLNEKFDYEVLQHLKEIAPDHQFTITLNEEANLETFKEKIKLATLGGKLIDFEVKYLRDNQYQVTPSSPLQPGGEYAMYIQPGWADQEGHQANKGVIVRISVTSQ